ncbi:tRNA (adenosine(37)-N6)-threonylcarbamoyltransferase complex ATPase subunit type 1 TsaE [Tenacibaculum aestuariivivum]|uniref:tRNA (adenosine(37)-N6)-threonylcarbamoyltransferase complex ATPase subunit type 1 TsaE n=1 Tax=Tenacibaculum aestuariivivum TaxID=2006131 RepID=UPI003AB43063
MNINYSLKELPKIADKIIKNTKHKVLLFHGNMGVGKTTLIKEICKSLGIQDIVHSPTFSIVNEYRTKNNDIIYHFDFYRIENEEEAYDIGIEDYLYSNNWCLIEWPENVKNLLPLKAVAIKINLLENGQRNIQLKNNQL